MKNKQNPLYTSNTISTPIEGMFTEDLAYFLVNNSKRPFQTSAEDDKLAVTAYEKGLLSVLTAPISFLDQKDGATVNAAKISYVKKTWDEISDDNKLSLIGEYVADLMQARQGEEVIGFPKGSDGKTMFPSGFAGLLKNQITGGKDNKRQNLDAFWSDISEKKRDSLIEKYCNSGDDAAKEKARTEIVTSYNSRSKEGIQRVETIISNAVNGIGEFKESSYLSDISKSLTSIASAAAAILPTASLFSRFGAAAASDSPSQSPTSGPSAIPTNSPTFHPTRIPTLSPIAPSIAPSIEPSRNPTETPSAPSMMPTLRPSIMPTRHRYTLTPTVAPTPTDAPTFDYENPNFGQPTPAPTTVAPSFSPTNSTIANGNSGHESGLSEDAAIAIGVVSAFVALGGIVTMAKKCCGASPRGASAAKFSQAKTDERDNNI